jgi:hypothetical protein
MGEVMTMVDVTAARINAHRSNIKRYCRLLATELTEIERSFVRRRIAEERLALEQLHQLSAETDCDHASSELIATQAAQSTEASHA